MELHLEISDDVVNSIEQYLATQVRVETDTLTKSQKAVRIYPDAQTFLEDALHQTITQVVRQFPYDSLRAQLQAEAQAAETLKQSIKPKRLDASAQGVGNGKA